MQSTPPTTAPVDVDPLALLVIGVALTFAGVAYGILFGALRPAPLVNESKPQSQRLRIWLTLIACVAAFLGVLVIGSALVAAGGAKSASVSTQLALQGAASIAVIVTALFALGPKFFGITASRVPGGVGLGLVLLPAAMMLTYGLSIAITAINLLLHHETLKPHAMIAALRGDASPLERLLIATAAIVVAPVLEEFFFRGLVQRLLRSYGVSPSISIALTAVGFGAIHEPRWIIFPVGALAIVMGYAYERSRTLWAPITIHVAFNATSTLAALMSK